MYHLLILFFMKIKSTCICGVSIFNESQKYCDYCIRDRQWDLFLHPRKTKSDRIDPVGERTAVEKNITKLAESLKLAKKDLLAVKKLEKEEKAMMEQQQIYLKRFTENVPEMKRKIQKKILA